MQHLSLRLVWHDRAWDGCVCNHPQLNVYCQGQFSVGGDFIKANKETSWEKQKQVAGHPCAELWKKEGKLPPCTWTINAFSKQESPVRHVHPFITSAKPIIEIYPEYSAGTWAMDKMYDIKDKKLVDTFEQREENIQGYFEQFTEEKSLVFFYLNYDNPINPENKKYVLVGISTLQKFGPYQGFEGINGWQMDRYGNRAWTRYVRHKFADGLGVRIPYQEYLEAGKKPEEFKEIVVEISGELERQFKYVSRPLKDDDACELIQKTIESIKQVKKDGIVPGDWDNRLQWLNAELSKTWSQRGLYPGIGSVLELLGVPNGTTLVKELSAKMDSDKLKDYVFKSLKMSSKEKWAQEAKLVWAQYSLNTTKQKLLERLCSFDLTTDQMEKIISEKSTETGIKSSLEDILENPYCICEEYEGEDEDDVIGFYRIDNGLIPHSSLNKASEIQLDDPRRVRALMIEKLRSEEKSSGNCFLELNDLLDHVEKHDVAWKKCLPTVEKIKAKSDVYEKKEKLQLVEHNGRLYVYLQTILNDEDVVRARVEKLLKSKAHPASGENWTKRLEKPHPNIPNKIYSKVLEQQAAAAENSFERKISVITGAAGTGKTTVIKSLIEVIKKKSPGTSFLLLTPTGKARENLEHHTGMAEETMTIHRALKRHGWLAKRSFRFVENKTNMIEANNIIIDESSMIPLPLLARLFRAIQWALVDRIIFVGDHNQLPPIGFGRPFFDIINYFEQNNNGAVKYLTINCRQITQQTNILKLASVYTEKPDKDFDTLLNKIEKGKNLGNDMDVVFWDDQSDLHCKIHEKVNSMLKEKTPNTTKNPLSIDNLLDIQIGSDRKPRSETFSISYFQILSPYRGDYYGTNALNNMMQAEYRKRYISSYGFMEGFTTADKVIQVANNTIYSKDAQHEVYNGQLGYVCFIPSYGKRWGMFVSYPKAAKEESIGYSKKIIDQNLELGYAITVHKAQGSEFEYIFLILPREETGLISRELLYTALTRSRSKLIIFLQKDIMPLMTAKQSGKSAILLRNTSLFTFRFTSEKYRENDLVHRTSKGEYVRSKSELAIANLLYSNDIYYKYEQQLFSKDGSEWKLPDFTIRTEDGETYYWEHLGRLENDPQYAEDWEEKKQWYKENGYFDRLVWSDEIGGFDSKKIEQILKKINS